MINWPYCCGIGFTALVLALQHWIPWKRPLRPLEAYTLGTATIWVGVGIALLFSPLFWQLAVIPVAGGIAVGIGYAYDTLLNIDVRRGLDE